MKMGTTAIVSYLFVLERSFRNEEEGRDWAGLEHSHFPVDRTLSPLHHDR